MLLRTHQTCAEEEAAPLLSNSQHQQASVPGQVDPERAHHLAEAGLGQALHLDRPIASGVACEGQFGHAQGSGHVQQQVTVLEQRIEEGQELPPSPSRSVDHARPATDPKTVSARRQACAYAN